MNETKDSPDSIASLRARRSLLIEEIARSYEARELPKDLTRELMAIDARILALEESQRDETT